MIETHFVVYWIYIAFILYSITFNSIYTRAVSLYGNPPYPTLYFAGSR